MSRGESVSGRVYGLGYRQNMTEVRAVVWNIVRRITWLELLKRGEGT